MFHRCDYELRENDNDSQQVSTTAAAATTTVCCDKIHWMCVMMIVQHWLFGVQLIVQSCIAESNTFVGSN